MASMDRSPCPIHRTFFLFLALHLLCATAHAQRDSASPPPPGYANFSPSTAIIIVVILTAFFCMAFFSLYIRRCSNEDHVAVDRGVGVAPGTTRQARRGLDKALVESFPTMVYSEVKGLKIGKEGALECAVCLCEFEDEETLRLLPRCSHAFHPECIDMWLDSHATCPVCRANLAVPVGSDTIALTSIDVAEEEDYEVGRQRQEEEVTVPPEHLVITVDEEEIPVAPAVPGRSRSARVALVGRLPAWTEEEKERFTLRLPKEVTGKKRLDRSVTMAFPVAVSGGGAGGGGASSARRGYRRGVGGNSFKMGRWEWAAKSDRWAFLARTLSLTKAHTGGEAAGAGEKGQCSDDASVVGNLGRV